MYQVIRLIHSRRCTADARLNPHVCKIDVMMIAGSHCMKPRLWKQCIYRCHSSKHSSSRDTTDRLIESLRSLLHMPLGSAEQVATAISVVDACDLHVSLENLQLLAEYFPPSSFRSLEKLVTKNPLVLVTPLAPWRDFLAAYGVSEQAFCGIIMWQAAAIITSSTPFQAGTVMLTLQNWGLSSTHINKSVLLRAPQVLFLPQPCLQTLYSFLNGVCLLSADRIRDLVVASPHVLVQDVQDLQRRVAMLQQDLGADQEHIAKILHRCPGLLMADSISTVQPRLQQLRQFGFEGPELLQLVTADPELLSLSISALQRKWQYLTGQMGLGRQHVLQQCPTYFTRNLMTDIGPRHSFVLQRKLQAYLACSEQQQGHQQDIGQSVRVTTQHSQQQAQRQTLVQPNNTIHLGMLLDPSIPEFLGMLGQADAAAEYAAHVQLWAQTEGLQWTAVRVT